MSAQASSAINRERWRDCRHDRGEYALVSSRPGVPVAARRYSSSADDEYDLKGGPRDYHCACGTVGAPRTRLPTVKSCSTRQREKYAALIGAQFIVKARRLYRGAEPLLDYYIFSGMRVFNRSDHRLDRATLNKERLTPENIIVTLQHI